MILKWWLKYRREFLILLGRVKKEWMIKFRLEDKIGKFEQI